MAVVNLDRKFIYICNAHVASRATTKALVKLQGSKWVEPHHCPPSVVYEAYPESKDFKTFMCVRNPYDWLVSRFLCNGGHRGRFKNWLRRRNKKPIFGRFPGVEKTVKFETLETDLEYMIGCHVQLERDPRHVTPDKPDDYLTYYDQEDLDWVYGYFKTDFERFGYEHRNVPD